MEAALRWETADLVAWRTLEVAIDVPGLRDDDALPIFLGAMLSEALCADGGLRDRLWINSRFHWRLYVDVSFAAAVWYCFYAGDSWTMLTI